MDVYNILIMPVISAHTHTPIWTLMGIGICFPIKAAYDSGSNVRC